MAKKTTTKTTPKTTKLPKFWGPQKTPLKDLTDIHLLNAFCYCSQYRDSHYRHASDGTLFIHKVSMEGFPPALWCVAVRREIARRKIIRHVIEGGVK